MKTPEEPTDDEVMALVRDGDLRKAGVLFDRQSGALFGFFCRTTGDVALSQDLVQEVFLRMVKYRATFRGGRFTTWMYHIARNVRADHYKKYRHEGPLTEEGNEDAEAPGHERPDARWERERQAALLERALMGLAAEKRELIVLARYRQLSYREIAEIHGVDVGTIKVRVHRAVQELRTIFLKLAGEKSLCDVKTSEDILPTI